MADLMTIGLEPTSESDLEQFRAAASSLDEFLDDHPEAEHQILEIVARRLDGEMDLMTAQTLHSSLAAYVGEQPALLIAWAASGPDPSARVEALGDEVPPRAEGVVRRVAALYAPEFQNAWTIWDEMPHAWRNFFREIYWDALNARPLVRVRIDKYNGETITIEGAPTSILQLATNMLITIGFIRNVAADPDVFRSDILETFLQEADTVLDYLRAKEETPAA
jgi:hypothetical protein